MSPTPARSVLCLAIGIAALLARHALAETAPADASSSSSSSMTLQNVKVQGSLDLDNGVPIRWKKPDGSGYVNIFTLDKNGTLQLCSDSFFFDQPRPDKSVTAKGAQEKELRRKLDEQHNTGRVIEVRNPNSLFPDLRLPITRSRAGSQDIWDNDSKLTVRSASFVETNDPAELNLIRVGNDDVPLNDETAPVKDGSIAGIVRFMARCSPAKKGGDDHSGIGTDAEIIGRNYGTTEQNHRGGMFFLVKDNNIPDATDSSGVMAMVQPGVRIGHMTRSPGEGKTGSILEVDLDDDRPVLFRRAGASTTQPVALALASGKNGTPADAANSLALIKSTPSDAGSRLEIQTNKGKRLETDWVLPVPAAKASSDARQFIPSGELVPLTFHHNVEDSDAMHDPSRPTRLTCRTAGRYSISAAVEFAANGYGSRQVVVRVNGRDQAAAMRVPAVVGESTQINFTAPPLVLKPGDYVELMVRQTSGQTLEVPAGGQTPTTFSMTRVG